MPASTAILGYGTKLEYSITTGTYVRVGQTVDLNFPEIEVADVDITNDESPDFTKEYIPGLLDPGEVEAETVYKKAVVAALYQLLGDRTVCDWRLTLSDGSKWEWKGFLKSIGGETPTDSDKVKATFAIKITSKPVFTPAV